MALNSLENIKIAVIGMGYVGLPLAVEFGKKCPVVGFDINPARIAELRLGNDSTLEVESAEMAAAQSLSFSSEIEDIADCRQYIVTVPTPIDAHKRPDLTPLLSASKTVGSVLKSGDTVIYESTVYPGATEEDCVPVLEQASGLTFNTDFTVGYSPERINPGDKEHRLTQICKVTSGSSAAAADFVDDLYNLIINAGTHKAPSIRVAEAAKVIENTQRDLNIALINELSLIFHKLDINTQDVLEAAGTKWNFLPFHPGLVGGHCIGVDPYYLTHKAESVGYRPEVVLAGRRINDSMGGIVANRLIREMILRGLKVKGERILVLGLAFKENCPDLRNTRVIDVINELKQFGAEVDVFDPRVDSVQARECYGLELTDPNPRAYSGIVVAVAHDEFKAMTSEYYGELKASPDSVIMDIKSVLPAGVADLFL